MTHEVERKIYERIIELVHCVRERNDKHVAQGIAHILACTQPSSNENEKVLLNEEQKNIRDICHQDLPQRLRDQWEPFLSRLYAFSVQKKKPFLHDDLHRIQDVLNAYQAIFCNTKRISPASNTSYEQSRTTHWMVLSLKSILAMLVNITNTLSFHADPDVIQTISRDLRRLILFSQRENFQASPSNSRVMAVPYLANAFMSVLFASLTLEPCRALVIGIGSTDRRGCRLQDISSRGQWLCYVFYTSRLRMYDGTFDEASDMLRHVFMQLPETPAANKEILLFYLTISELCCGKKTEARLLQKYKLDWLLPLTHALEKTSYHDFYAFRKNYESSLRRRGVYALLHHILKEFDVLIIKRVHYILKKLNRDPSRIRIEYVMYMMKQLGALESQYRESSLVSKLSRVLTSGKVKGYHAQEHKVIVLSRQNPFPTN